MTNWRQEAGCKDQASAVYDPWFPETRTQGDPYADHLRDARINGDIPDEAGRIHRRILRPITNHGGRPGWTAHRRRGEDPCPDCAAGYSAYQRSRRVDREAS